MADGVTLNPGAGGAEIDTEQPSTRGLQIQRIKMVLGDVDADAGDVAKDNAMPVSTPVGTASFAAAQSTVGVSAAILVAARTGAVGTGRAAVTIYNNGTATIYLGASGVTISTGFPIVAGNGFTTNTTAAIYAISGTAGQNVGVWETF